MEEKINNENNDNRDTIPEEMIREIPVLGKAPDIAQCVKDYAIRQVDNALEKIKALQEDETIYLPHNGEQVQKIHKDLINKLTNIKYGDLGCDLGALSFDTIMLKEAIANNISKIFTDICSDGYCAPDDDYFVGIKGKKRDMKAPKEAVDFVSAPLREIFHFDEQDYDNVDKYYPDDDELKDNENIIVTDESFLNSGLEIPEIWRYILRRHAFIEKDMNFKALFNRGNAKKQYLRSGIYPCLFNNRVIDVTNAQKAKKITTTVNKGFGTGIAVPVVQKYDEYDDTDFIIGDFGYTINKTGDVENYGKLQECQSFIGDGNNITDRQAGGAIIYGKQGEYEEKEVVGTSELGNILSYIPDPRFKVINLFTGAKNKNDRYKLTFNANLQRAIYNVNNFQAVDDDPREKALYYLSERSLLKNNQFGGYLDYVEIESSIAKSLADIENQMEGIKQSLRDVFAGLGYALSDDFDVSDENDYNLALSTLNSYKENYMRRALDVIENIQGVTDKIKNETEKLLHEIDVLMTDRDEFVNITGQEDLDELEEKIKTNKANRAVEEEYEREGTEAILNQIDQLPSPYCAIYSN